MNLRTWITLAVFLAPMAVAQDAVIPPDRAEVNAAVGTWVDAKPVDAVVRVLMGELGYDVGASTELPNPIFYRSVMQGDVDYWPSVSYPLHEAQMPDGFEDEASLVGTIIENGVLQGYLVSKEAAEEYGITSLDDFRRPEVKEAFDADGDGRADLVACPPGWGCEIKISHHMDVYDLHDHIDPIEASYNASFADAVARHRAGQPVLVYTWTPNFTVRSLVPGEDVVWINVPEIVPTEDQQGLEDAMVVEGLEGAVSDPLLMGFVVNDYKFAANDAFLERNPEARTLFEHVEIPLEDVSEMTARIVEGEDSAEAILAIAEEWVAAHRDQVDAWLEAARAAAP